MCMLLTRQYLHTPSYVILRYDKHMESSPPGIFHHIPVCIATFIDTQFHNMLMYVCWYIQVCTFVLHIWCSSSIHLYNWNKHVH